MSRPQGVKNKKPALDDQLTIRCRADLREWLRTIGERSESAAANIVLEEARQRSLKTPKPKRAPRD